MNAGRSRQNSSRRSAIRGRIASNSPAAAAGLKTGDEIVAVNDQKFPCPAMAIWLQLISNIGKASRVHWSFDRQERNEQSCTVTPQNRSSRRTARRRIGIVFRRGLTRCNTRRRGRRSGTFARRWSDTFGALAHSKQTGVGAQQTWRRGDDHPVYTICFRMNTIGGASRWLQRAAQHEPRLHQSAAHARARRRPHCHGHSSKKSAAAR